MRCCVLFALLSVFLAGCTSPMTLEDKALREHVVDACFTVQETMAPKEAMLKVDEYLLWHQESGDLSEREVYVIKVSLERAKKK